MEASTVWAVEAARSIGGCFAASASAAGCLSPQAVPIFVACVHGVHAWAERVRGTACCMPDDGVCMDAAGARMLVRCVFNESLS